MPNQKKTYNFEASELTFFHRVSFETWVGVEELNELLSNSTKTHFGCSLDSVSKWILATATRAAILIAYTSIASTEAKIRVPTLITIKT